MTTSTNEEKPRTINELIDLPYSDMSEEEIELVVQFKADVQTRENVYQAEIAAISETLAQAAQVHMDLAEQAQARLDALTQHAIERFNEVSQ